MGNLVRCAWLGLLLTACGPTAVGGDGESDARPSVGGSCQPGTQACDGTTRLFCQDGELVAVEQCAAVCDPGLGCVACQPGLGTCNGEVSTYCRTDGSGYAEEVCDPVLGSACDMDTGRCTGACTDEALGDSYIGCEYYPTVTANMVNPEFAFAVVVSNTTDTTATVTIDGGALGAPAIFDVGPDSASIRELPWTFRTKYCRETEETTLCKDSLPLVNDTVPGAAYRLRSTSPVTVYQFAPLDYTKNGDDCTSVTKDCSYVNDASLLLPANALRGEYVVAGYPFEASSGRPGFLTVTGLEDGTAVTLRATVSASGNPALQAGVPTVVQLDQGDVLQVLDHGGDLTGSLVEADRPVQVIAGHYCTKVPQQYGACDHLEESLYPTRALGTDYLVTSPATPTLPAGRRQIVRIVAAAPDVQVSFEPAVAPARTLASVGDVLTLPLEDADFRVVASDRVIVQQLIVGLQMDVAQYGTDATGDPALSMAVPTPQYRSDYQFHAPPSYTSNYVNITAPMGATITLDGNPVTGFTAIGATGHGVAKVQLDDGPGGDGTHRATGDQPFGIMVYGYGWTTSYFYAGGLSLNEIIVE